MSDLDREVDEVIRHGKALLARSREVSDPEDRMVKALNVAYAQAEDAYRKQNVVIHVFEAG